MFLIISKPDSLDSEFSFLRVPKSASVFAMAPPSLENRVIAVELAYILKLLIPAIPAVKGVPPGLLACNPSTAQRTQLLDCIRNPPTHGGVFGKKHDLFLSKFVRIARLAELREKAGMLQVLKFINAFTCQRAALSTIIAEAVKGGSSKHGWKPPLDITNAAPPAMLDTDPLPSNPSIQKNVMGRVAHSLDADVMSQEYQGVVDLLSALTCIFARWADNDDADTLEAARKKHTSNQSSTTGGKKVPASLPLLVLCPIHAVPILAFTHMHCPPPNRLQSLPQLRQQFRKQVVPWLWPLVLLCPEVLPLSLSRVSVRCGSIRLSRLQVASGLHLHFPRGQKGRK